MADEKSNITQEDEMNIAAVLDVFAYSEQATMDFKKYELGDIVSNSSDRSSEAVKAVTDNNPEIASMVLIDQSSISRWGKPAMNNEYITACTFQNPETNDIYVCFCGTLDGQWIDDGEAMAHENSVMQEEAVKYFDYIYEKYGETSARIIVTGHSKGGNEAQYVTLNSQYAEQIDACYSYDGQGFSQTGIDAVVASRGQDFFDAQCQKMYSICGDSDPVHGMGHTIIPEEHTYYVKTNFSLWPSNIANCHDLRGMLGNYGINWSRDENGNIVSAEERSFSRFAKSLSENLNQLSDEEYEDCTIAFMYILELVIEDEKTGYGERKYATTEEMLGLLLTGGPTVIRTIFTTPEGRQAYLEVWMRLLGKPNLLMAFYTITLLAVALMLIGPELEPYTDIWNYIFAILYANMEENFINVMESMYQTFMVYIDNMLQPIGIGQNRNQVQLESGTYIQVDTCKMGEYANRLEWVRQKMLEIEQSVSHVYLNTKKTELARLMQTDTLSNQRYRLQQCINWLRDTTVDFEAVERQIVVFQV